MRKSGCRQTKPEWKAAVEGTECIQWRKRNTAAGVAAQQNMVAVCE